MTVANSSLSQQYILDIEPEGRLTLPQEIQQILNLESGDRLTSHKICPCPQNSLILTIYLFQVV